MCSDNEQKMPETSACSTGAEQNISGAYSRKYFLSIDYEFLFIDLVLDRGRGLPQAASNEWRSGRASSHACCDGYAGTFPGAATDGSGTN